MSDRPVRGPKGMTVAKGNDAGVGDVPGGVDAAETKNGEVNVSAVPLAEGKE